MFTGLIEATGLISSLQGSDESCRLVIGSDTLDFSDVMTGDSIAVNGVCLTATEVSENEFQADVSVETLRCTSLGKLQVGARVNLEKALKVDQRLGGHIVSGHVDGLAKLENKQKHGDNLLLNFSVPMELAHYIAKKGSVCLDGVSLTVNEVDGAEFSVMIIPHTASETIIESYEPGDEINLEVDLLGRYLERLLQKQEMAVPNTDAGQGTGLTLEKLIASGFIKGSSD
tara:strand:- start:2540 stop:3226 length:687 start_codon:yes stop_codon:yes gene_type:complete